MSGCIDALIGYNFPRVLFERFGCRVVGTCLMLVIFIPSLFYPDDLTTLADSEMRMDDLALHDDFSEQSRSWDDSGTITSDT